LTDKPRLLLFCFSGVQRFVSHVNTLKQNWNKTVSLKQNIVLRLFCFSFVSVLFQL